MMIFGHKGAPDRLMAEKFHKKHLTASEVGTLSSAQETISRWRDDIKEIKRACDALLVGWLVHSEPSVRASWHPLSLHTVKDSYLRRMGGDAMPGAKKQRLSIQTFGKGGPIIRSFEPVQLLGFAPRPKGAAPGNDQGTRVTWSYKRGKYVDTEYPGTWKGVPASEGEEEAVAAETADLDIRLAALAAGCDAEVVKNASTEEVTKMTEAAEAASKAEVAEAESKAEADVAADAEALRREHEASIDPLEVMERLLPKLEGRVELRLQDPEAFATRVALGGERGHATLAARTKDIVKRGPRQKEARKEIEQEAQEEVQEEVHEEVHEEVQEHQEIAKEMPEQEMPEEAVEKEAQQDQEVKSEAQQEAQQEAEIKQEMPDEAQQDQEMEKEKEVPEEEKQDQEMLEEAQQDEAMEEMPKEVHQDQEMEEDMPEDVQPDEGLMSGEEGAGDRDAEGAD